MAGSQTKLLFLLLAALAACVPGMAAAPVSGVLSGKGAPVSWSGGPFTAVATDAGSCTGLNCDTFYLTVNIASGFFPTHPNHEVQIRMTWPETTNEFDLYLYDAAGNLLASSVQSGEPVQEIYAGPLSNGTYKLLVVAARTVNALYSGSALIIEDPPVPNGKARYQPGEMSFAAPFQLHGPRGQGNATESALADHNLGPRIVHDPLGNLYVAATPGLPGTVVVWKSYDTGKTFTYLGPPEDLQEQAIRTAADRQARGGVQDLAIGTSGNVYLNLLWQGSTIQASSFNGGGSWVVNPLPSEIPVDGRQWIAAAANNTVYLTYKQLGERGDGTSRIVVAKSADGGITFPQNIAVTTSMSGVQPGNQGNLVVDPTNGNVYTVFLDQSGAHVYLARSTDDGVTFELRLVYESAAEALLPRGYPSIAADGSGNLHVVFSNGRNTFLTTSQNSGETWSPAVRVNNGANTRTAIQPWVIAGDSGKVDITWLGSPVTNSSENSAEWRVFLAQSQDDFASVPSFAQATVTEVIHAGPTCASSSPCDPGTSMLRTYWAPDVYLDGSALIVYPDDKNSAGASGNARTWFVRQTAGPTIIQTVQ